jgi:hypothetical protein
MAAQPLQILDPDGALVADPPMDLDGTRRLYRAMVAARSYDRKCNALQKQGRLATYASFEGQEAAQIGFRPARIEARVRVIPEDLFQPEKLADSLSLKPSGPNEPLIPVDPATIRQINDRHVAAGIAVADKRSAGSDDLVVGVGR